MAKFRQPPQSASEATIVSKTIASNGTYYASADSADGYNPVVVEVPGEHATIVSKNITANGTYNASQDSADGYDPVTVAVPEKVIVSKNITANGTYNASSDSADGYNPVTVAVPPPTLGTKSITSNGTYTASSDNLDGYSQVVVAVSGGTATITVSYSSQFYNKTMTCSMGGTTYTETTTSSGVTVFNVDSSGTWTITCDGVSRTVDVVLEYSTSMAITKTITVYSTASDTVSFSDMTGAKTVTTDTSGVGSVSITFIPPSANITFTSSVAKNPSDLTADYSKTVTVDSNTTEVYLMPNNALYWWGYNNGIENLSVGNGWSGGTYEAPSHLTNYIDCKSTGYVCGIGSVSALNASKIIEIAQGITINASSYGGINIHQSKNTGSELAFEQINDSSIKKYEINTSNFSNFYISSYANSNRENKVYAVWYE